MSHAYHHRDHLPNYVAGALFHTGCEEYERRAKMGVDAIRFMDPERVRYAANRAYTFECAGDKAFPVDDLEIDFLRSLGRVIVSFNAAGLAPPLLRSVS